uniref:Uncharacterized protein n=1 Tax=Rhizophora mucronata TaxID=61149 RepID=A0A2P2NGJ3_RHIMU
MKKGFHGLKSILSCFNKLLITTKSYLHKHEIHCSSNLTHGSTMVIYI